MAIPFEKSLAAKLKDPIEREMHRSHRAFIEGNLQDIMREVRHEYIMRTLEQAIRMVIWKTYEHAWVNCQSNKQNEVCTHQEQKEYHGFVCCECGVLTAPIVRGD